MPLITVTSPHSTSKADTGRVMRHVIYATLPALAVMTWAFGLGNLLNVLWCIFLAVALEALCLKMRGKPIPFFLKDYSAAVTGLLLGLSISPFAPWWISVIGMIFAIPIAKHLYGGLGSNPFNPAMIGYALLLVSFPVEMTRWAGMSITATPEQTWLMFSGQSEVIDQITGATWLDTFKIAALKGIENNHFWLDSFQLKSWMTINIAFLIGGIYLLYRKIITWHIPVSVLATLTVLSSLFFYWDNNHYASPILHLLSGATMMGAFFIATDPVSAATSLKGRLIYGAGIGALLYIIRTWGGYPDAIAFAVLFMNLCAPMIDHLVQPRTFGHDIQPVKWRKEQKMMSQAMRSSALTLGVFALIATGMVAGFHALTDQRILQSQQQSLTESLNALVTSSQYNNDLLHDTLTIQNNDLLHLEQPETVFRVRKNGLPIAVIFPVIAPDGYSGKIRLLVAIYANGELAGVRVLAHKETPGLGDAIDIDKSSWILDFNHKSLLSPNRDGWHVKKDKGVFDQFTGATITPRAVVNAVHNALLYYQLHQQTLFSPVVAAHE